MDNLPVDATPQKRLFHSIIADYSLLTSLCELIDNAIDHWLMAEASSPLEINVLLSIDRQVIRVSDNAGGVPSDALELLVAPGASRENVKKEIIGNFGVGGKRAGVALGERVEIRSRHANGPTYSIVVDNEWLADERDWSLTAKKISDISAGTTEVHISNLRQGFSRDQVVAFENRLSEIYSKFINPNCIISVNGSPVLQENFDNWAYPPDYPPRSAEFKIQPLEASDEVVTVKITAGLISDRNPKDGNYGVYFYCNKRLILAHEKGREVGYFSGKAGTPHPDASLCRVIVELSGRPELMPWTSNKAGINWSHPTFQLIRDGVIELTGYFTKVSRRTKTDRENSIFKYDSGEISPIKLDEPDSLKKIVSLPTPRGRKKSYADRLLDQNTHITKKMPWTLGLLEALSMFEVLAGKKYHSRNRLGLIILDSNLEIALKEFLVNSNQYYSDDKISKLFSKRHLVIEEIKKHITIDDGYWKKTSYYNNLRNKLIHERATVDITDYQLADFAEVVEHILGQLFGFDFSRN